MSNNYNVTYSSSYSTGKFRIGSGTHWAAYGEGGELVAKGSDWTCTPTDAELVEWSAVAQQVAQTMAGKWAMIDQDLYIRFGNLPKNGRSRNYATSTMEAGISVFDARCNLLTGAVELAGGALAGAAIMAAFGAYGDTVLLVTGEYAGAGSDGEPVLRKVKTLAQLSYDESKGGFVTA
jgi:hypothetical protein